MPTNLSAHFTLEEMTSTQMRGLDNTPPSWAVDNLRLLVEDLLEPLRDAIGPLHINSGYRSPQVNAVVKGQSTSQHCEGLAADFLSPRYSLQEVVRRIQALHLPFDQLIYEYGDWVHLSHAPIGRLARIEPLMIGKWTADDAGKMKYLPLDLSKVPS